MTALESWVKAKPEREKLFAQEYLIALVSEMIHEAMNQENGMTRADVARSLGKSKAYVSQILDGSRNMTLRTLADIATALGKVADFRLVDAAQNSDWEDISERPARWLRYRAKLDIECVNDGLYFDAPERAAA